MVWGDASQQDATEFLTVVFMLADMQRANDEQFAAVLSDSFGFVYESKLKCRQCGLEGTWMAERSKNHAFTIKGWKLSQRDPN